MAYPDRPDFVIGQPFAAWFLVVQGTRPVQVCATQGASLLRRLEHKIAPTLAPIGRWNRAMLTRLADYAGRLDAAHPGQGWATVREQIQQRVRAAELDAFVMRFAIWVAYLDLGGAPGEKPFESVQISRNALLPAAGQIPEPDENPDSTGAAYCWFRDSEAAPTVWQFYQYEPPAPKADQNSAQPRRSAAQSGVSSGSAARPVLTVIAAAALLGLIGWVAYVTRPERGGATARRRHSVSGSTRARRRSAR